MTITADFAGLPLDAVNSPRLWRGVTAGATLDSAADITYSYAGVNLKPLSPVNARGHRDPVSADLTIIATRRSRWPVELFSGLVVPVGESAEAYEIEIWDSTYTALKRTFSGLSSLYANYTSAMQVADFGSNQETIYIKAYQLSATVGRGFPLVASLYRKVEADPFIAYNTLLLHMNDTGLTDVYGHAITLQGGAARSATQSKYGGYSAYFDGSGDCLTVSASSDFGMGTGDFTLEAWIYPTALGADRGIIDLRGALIANNGTFFIDIATGKLAFWDGAALKGASGTVVPTNVWSHVACCRSGTTLRFFLNGALDATAMMSTDIGSSKPVGIGGSAAPGNIAGSPFVGYIDEVRITKAARYTDAFSAPTEAFNDS